jgi:alpha-tubulin suppressor-like RCC1 family protein
MSNACGTCRPTSCFEQGVSGGFIADGCGGQLYCGDPSPSRLSASDNASCIVTTAGGVQCWGIGTNGQLGNNTTTNSNRPVVATGLTNARTVSGGPLSGCALTNDGAVWCWGYNAFGQLGDNSSTARLTPVRVQGFGPSAPALAIATGGNTACAVTWDRRLACWGYDNAGQLGRGFVSGTGANPRPEAVRELTRVVDVAVSNNTVCAARDNGTVWCFGLAGSGQHGNGGMGDSSVPRQVANVQNAINVEGARGGDSFCAIRADGTVACWGTNASGQLGDGSTTLRNTPVAVSGLTGASHLAIGDNHTCAALTSGAMSCWGNNGSSKLGDGTTTQRNTPVAVLASPGVPLAGVLDVATQASTTCALQANGNVSCWGLGTSGQIGDGQSLSRTTPTRVLGF